MRPKQPLLFFILGASMCLFVFLNLPFFFDLDTIVNSLRYFEAYKYQDVDYGETYSKQEHEESFVARELKQNVRILCWIMSGPGNTKKAMAELNNYDWFLKADDDTFVIMENLRFMLLAYSPDDPIYFGCKLKPQVRHDALNNTEQCRPNLAKDEDVYVGKCLESVHVVAGDSRDIHGNHRMLPLSNRLCILIWTKPRKFKAPLSEYVISFHYIGNGQMLALYNQFYNMRVFGISDGLKRLAKPEDGEKK
ncbi:N-acetylgalactosaminide beta-1,3-galactosyltransferase [Aphelenchoides besseyi]|nr:N-acetylgalactosaminide beta-1,3-galactosyltransferase [Aphelenchoides besseyi]